MSKVKTETLQMRQRYPLNLKVDMSLNRIKYWYNQYAGNVYVAFSGGKDSTVLLHLVRKLYPEVPAVFVNTGLEYPEINQFVKTIKNVITLRPTMTFKEVIEKKGYPVVSKKVARGLGALQSPGTSDRERNKVLHGDERGSYGKLPKKWRYLENAQFKISEKCCEVLKLRPVNKYYKQTNRTAYIGTMACDSDYRRMIYMKYGCYLTEHRKIPTCTPMGFWLQQDVWDYIKKYKLKYSKIYDMGVSHTGCIFCCFGVHLEGRPNRFDCMQVTHPKLYTYCMDKLHIRKVLETLGIYEYDGLIDVRKMIRRASHGR
jgi:3'-phosphoadenosine 5'-phosphosulfate sulfotransferase (PAPS reductase)/FAD synthetase